MKHRLPTGVRVLLALFPEDFRRLHESGLTRDYPGPTTDFGWIGRARYWAGAMGDLFVALCGVWWDRLITGRKARDTTKGTMRMNVMGNLLFDIRYALRGLRRAPAFTTMAILTIALGLGANAAIFSVVNGVLLRPLPYEDSTELARVWSRFLPESGFDFPYFSVDPTEYLDLRDNNRSFEAVAAHNSRSVTITGDGESAEVRNGLYTTWNLFELLGVEAAIGRTIVEEEDVAEGPSVVLLSYALWETRFGADRGLVGSTITLNREPFEVVGVLPPGFAFPDTNVDLYLPLQLRDNPSNRQSHYLAVVARLADGVSLEAAKGDIERMMTIWAQDYPEIHTGHFLFIEGLKEAMVSDVRPALLLLMGAVGLVLLVVCANVANLLLVRGQARLGEVAVRRALGASRWRVVQLGLLESVILAFTGAVLGLMLARPGLRGLLALDDGALPLATTVEVDGSVLAFTAALTVLTALAFGLAPAFQGLGHSAAGHLREEGRAGTATRSRLRARNILIAGEVALSFVLVIGAGLMARSLMNLLAENPGFDPEGVLVANFSLPAAAYPTAIEANAFLDEVVQAATALPGVTAVTHVGSLPMRGGQPVIDFSLEGLPEPGPGQPAWNAIITAIRANYFETMGIEVLEGRGFDPNLDRVDGVAAVVVSRRLADRFLAGREAVGQRMRLSGSSDDQPWWTIVGVVDDVKYSKLGDEESPTYYILAKQIPLYNALAGFERFGTFVVRTAVGEPLDVAEPFRRVVAGIDSQLPLTGVASLESVVGESIAQPRFVMALMGVFAALAIVLGAIGIYGVTSFVVSQRRQEMGIRKALGAEAGTVASLVIRQGMTPVLLGMVFGVGGAFATGRLLSSLLYGIQPFDGATYGVALCVLGGVAIAAVSIPALRASRLDPMVALRTD